MSQFGKHLENRLLRSPTKILPMMGFLTCNDGVISRWPKLVLLGGSSIEPISHLHCFLTALSIWLCKPWSTPLTGHADDQVFPVWPSKLEVCDAAGPSTHVGLQNQLPIYPSLPSGAHSENYHLHSIAVERVLTCSRVCWTYFPWSWARCIGPRSILSDQNKGQIRQPEGCKHRCSHLCTITFST